MPHEVCGYGAAGAAHPVVGNSGFAVHEEVVVLGVEQGPVDVVAGEGGDVVHRLPPAQGEHLGPPVGEVPSQRLGCHVAGGRSIAGGSGALDIGDVVIGPRVDTQPRQTRVIILTPPSLRPNRPNLRPGLGTFGPRCPNSTAVYNGNEAVSIGARSGAAGVSYGVVLSVSRHRARVGIGTTLSFLPGDGAAHPGRLGELGGLGGWVPADRGRCLGERARCDREHGRASEDGRCVLLDGACPGKLTCPVHVVWMVDALRSRRRSGTGARIAIDSTTKE